MCAAKSATPGVDELDDIEAYLAAHERKELLRFVVVGSVDDGKSTLIGRLLYDTDSVFDDQVAQVKSASKMAGTEIDFSLFTDGLLSEREQGITIDVAYRYFTTQKRKFIIADTPGHVQYTRNMVTGASTADVAVILIDARLGVLQQSRRHAFIASLLGIRHLVVAVNKMDLVAFDAAVFDRLREDVAAFTRSLSFERVIFLPISAVGGDNIVRKSERTPWYDGPTLLEVLETVEVARDVTAMPLRFPVQTVLRPNLNYRGYAGRVDAGRVRKGDDILVLPSKKTTRVVGIDTYEGEIGEAFAPQSVSIRLADEIDIGRGDMLVHATALPRVASRFDAMLVWLSERPLSTAKTYFIKHTTHWVRAEIESIAHVVDLETLGETSAASLGLNDIARVTMRTFRPLFLDAYAAVRKTGAFVVVDALTNETVGAGMILAGESSAQTATARDPLASRIAPRERQERLGQTGAVVPVEAPSRAQALATAFAAERMLFDRGALVAVVEDPGLAEACAAAGLVVLCVRTGAATRAPNAGAGSGVDEAEAERSGAALVEEYEKRLRR
jgi:bifunctional enzyme CysN/CysC/sulfate adenylyltransferase subunit 1